VFPNSQNTFNQQPGKIVTKVEKFQTQSGQVVEIRQIELSILDNNLMRKENCFEVDPPLADNRIPESVADIRECGNCLRLFHKDNVLVCPVCGRCFCYQCREFITVDGKGQRVTIGEHRYLAPEIEMKTVAAHAIYVAAQRDKDDPEEYNCMIVPANTPLLHEFEERFAPANPSSSEVVVKIVQGQKDEPSKNSALLRKITLPIQPSDHDRDRIRMKGHYTKEGLIELDIVDDLLGQPISDSFVYKASLSNAEIDQKRKQLIKDMGGHT
jgi:hypothetical protein